MKRLVGLVVFSSVVCACSDGGNSVAGQGGAAQGGAAQGGAIQGGGGEGAGQGGVAPSWSQAPALPEPVANNAVAAVETASGCMVLSAFGVDASAAQPGIHRRAWTWTDGDAAWTVQPDLPPTPGRIAASAVALRGKIYVIGGYSVAPNLSETSHADVSVFDPATSSWSAAAPLAEAIDDAVAVAWRDRYIVVVSGWADIQAPVDTVQIYDVESDSWAIGTPFPGTPVFGHAGALDGDTLVVIDGVEGSAFDLVNQSWRATLNPDDPLTIQWDDLGGHPAPARYRAAASNLGGELVFHGGAELPYNFDGLAYGSGAPAPPIATTLAYDPATGNFGPGVIGDKPAATMDHRGLVGCGTARFTVGGMVAGPEVTASLWRWGP
jgi:Kelch motif